MRKIKERGGSIVGKEGENAAAADKMELLIGMLSTGNAGKAIEQQQNVCQQKLKQGSRSFFKRQRGEVFPKWQAAKLCLDLRWQSGERKEN